MKILVVEDNKRFGAFLKRALEEEAYVVDRVAEGGAALTQLRTLAYDLLLLDWMLPDMDGLTVCRAVRSLGISLPIIMLTARGEPSERIAGLDAGADDYVPKPFDLGELLARVRAHVRRDAGGHVLTVGPLIIDRLQRRAAVAGQALALTPREFSLLAYLARSAARVVPRTELLSKVWETNFDPGSNVVEAHVKNLRDKLGAHGSLIETIRGAGYRLSAPP